MSLVEILQRRSEMSLELKGGGRLRGVGCGIANGVLELESDQTLSFVLVDEIAAVTIHGPTAVRTESDLLRRLETIGDGLQVEIVWAEPTPGADSLTAALSWFEAIAGALAGLSKDMREVVARVRLVELEMGRFAVADGVLEAGFAADIPAPAVRELQSLLAAIL